MRIACLKQFIAASVVATVALAAPSWAQNAEWKPEGPVTLILHTGPGGASDIFARTLQRSLEPLLGQPLVIENAPGGAGAVQMAKLRGARPDGLTLGINTMSHFTAMQTNLNGVFSPEDFSWIAVHQFDPHVVMANPDSGITDLDGLVAKAKAAPDQELTIGGYGSAGSVQHIAVSMLAEEAGFKVNWVGYNSTPEVITALMGGHLDAAIANPGPAISFIESGRVTGLGLLGHDRLTALPDVPTFAEQGYDTNPDWQQLRGLFGPADMPVELQDQIAATFHKAQEAPEFRAFEEQSGVIGSTMGPEEYKAYVAQVNEVAAAALKDVGLTQ